MIHTMDELERLLAEVRNAYGECIIDDDKITYTSEPSDDLNDGERRQSLENLLDCVADLLDEYEEEEA